MFGDHAGEAPVFVKSLGIDFAAGKQRRKFVKLSARRKRLSKVRKRVGKVAAVRKAVGSRARVLVSTGVVPAIGYGAEVTGIDGFELKAFQTHILAGCTPSGRGRSR
eukprot:15465766-Alexandrium_andersonii.AAC.1